jgi:hypothetical protein
MRFSEQLMIRPLLVLLVFALFVPAAGAVQDCDYYSLDYAEVSKPITPLWVGPADTLYGFYQNGVWASPDQGDTWSEIHHFTEHSHCNGFFVDSRGTIFVSRPASGTLQMGRYEDGGGRFWSEPLMFECGEGFWKMCEDRDGTLFIGEYAGGFNDTCSFIWRSTDEGTTWQKVYEGTSRHVHFVAADPYTGYIYAAVGDGVPRAKLIRSVDGGDTWEAILENDFLAQPISAVFTETHRLFGSDVGTLDLPNSVFWTDDDDTFTPKLVLAGDENTFVWGMVKNAQGTIFAGTLTRDHGNDEPAIYVSHDAGATWCKALSWGMVTLNYRGVSWMSNFDEAGYCYFHDNVTGKTYRFKDGPHEPNPVEGSYYGVLGEDGNVVLRWTVESLGGIDGFNVYRATSPTGPFELVNEEPLPASSPGVFEDDTAWSETTFWYELRAILSWGEEVVSGDPVSVTTGGRLRARLSAPAPNPFASSTSLEFDVPNHIGAVRLAVYDLRGRVVRTLVDGAVSTGRYPASWDGRDERGRQVPSGVYFVRLDVGGEVEARKLLLVK